MLKDYFLNVAKKYNRYIETDVKIGQSCVNCVRKQFSHPYNCMDGLDFIRSGVEIEKGNSCLNWSIDKQCKVD